jgi:hypothetical protein
MDPRNQIEAHSENWHAVGGVPAVVWIRIHQQAPNKMSASAIVEIPAVKSAPSVRIKATIAFALAAVGLAIAEVICQFGIGLGDPPLYQADSTMEYVLQPSKTYYRFHNKFSVNRYSMRADDFPPHKSSADELRVIVIGDSIIYGGVRIDQSEIDTEILKRDLAREFGRPVVVGNASAKSWGPPNELAYLKRFGTLDADVVVLELSSHDYADAPTFEPVVGISAEYPDKKPLSALTDLFSSYLLPRYLHVGATPTGVDKTMISAAQSEQDIAECRNAEREFFRFARGSHAKVALAQHLSLPELTGPYQTGYYANQAVAKGENVSYVDDADGLRSQLKSGSSPFYPRDLLHLNHIGQPLLAHTLQRAVELAIRGK